MLLLDDSFVKTRFYALQFNGSNYLTCALDTEMNFDVHELGDSIKDGNEATTQNKVKVMILLMALYEWKSKGRVPYCEKSVSSGKNLRIDIIT